MAELDGLWNVSASLPDYALLRAPPGPRVFFFRLVTPRDLCAPVLKPWQDYFKARPRDRCASWVACRRCSLPPCEVCAERAAKFKLLSLTAC